MQYDMCVRACAKREENIKFIQDVLKFEIVMTYLERRLDILVDSHLEPPLVGQIASVQVIGSEVSSTSSSGENGNISVGQAAENSWHNAPRSQHGKDKERNVMYTEKVVTL